jgi:hypothetical protein
LACEEAQTLKRHEYGEKALSNELFQTPRLPDVASPREQIEKVKRERERERRK